MTPDTASEALKLTVVFEDAGEGWVMARVPELPGVITQGRDRDEARRMARSAVRDWLTWWRARDAGTWGVKHSTAAPQSVVRGARSRRWRRPTWVSWRLTAGPPACPSP